MACVENIAPVNVDSEMEEGEIVDDLSDISSEEEFLLRQRLEVLENYNNVLERKKAKRTTFESGTKHKKEDALTYDLSEISATDLEDYCSPFRNVKVQKHQKTHHRPKRKKEAPSVVFVKSKEPKKKSSRQKKKTEVKVVSESSESEDEYVNRRKKLAEAVVVNKPNHDKTSLSERLQKMLCGVNPEPMKFILSENNTDEHNANKMDISNLSPISSQSNLDLQNDAMLPGSKICEVIDICTDEDSRPGITLSSVDNVDSVMKKKEHAKVVNKILDVGSDKDSDDDLELLRQHALKTKVDKPKKVQDAEQKCSDNKILSEDEDSDTTELRLICLKSALLKKAIEMKRKQKLQKRLSQSSNLHDDGFGQFMQVDRVNSDNNTDIESVDMDIGSDGDDKLKENNGDCAKNTDSGRQVPADKSIPVLMVTNEDELEEDEDLLRAKLLTSLSKNLPNLVNPNAIKSIEGITDPDLNSKKAAKELPKQPQPSVIPEEKRFIINVESDSEGEHEATKNLTKMHMKLSEQIDFQQKLDMFLKSTRMEVEKEKTTLPDVVQQPGPPKKNEKYVAKAVKNLPKSEQIEYKNLVKRMAELEKIKQARQSTMNLNNKLNVPAKDTLKPRNVTTDPSNLSAINSLEEKIKVSRKNIAEESAKMLKLKEEGTKLSQKFKIVATELRNIKTAIALNKKQQRSVQNCLTKIRLHHQMLLKSSLTSTHSSANTIPHLNHVNPKLQKENNPKEQRIPMILKEIPKENYNNPAIVKSTKIGVINNINQQNVENPKQNVDNPKQNIDNPKQYIEKPRQNIERPKQNVEKPKQNVEKPKQNVEKPKQNVERSKQNVEKPKLIVERPKQNVEKPKQTVEKPKQNVEKPKQNIEKQVVEKPKPLVLHHPRLSIEIDVTNNTKVVTMPQKESTEKNKDDKNGVVFENKRQSSHPVVEKGGGTKDKLIEVRGTKRRKSDDYRSPLDAFGSTTWEEDPNAILCPFEVCGDCKDADCKYLHTKTASK